MADSIENLLDNINSLDNANSDVVVLDNLNGTVDPYVIDNIGSDNVINVTEEIIVPETPITTDNGQMFVYVTKSNGSNDYHTLENKPSINGVTLVGNKTFSDLGLNFDWLEYETTDWVQVSNYYTLTIPYSTHNCLNAYVAEMMLKVDNDYENVLRPTYKRLANDSIFIKSYEPVDCKILIKGDR